MSDNASKWSATANSYSTTVVKLTGQGGEALLKLVESVRPFNDAAVVLDSGAGSGALTALLRQKDSKMPIVAADVAPGMLEMLAKRDIPNLKTLLLDASGDHVAQGLQENYFTHALTTFMLQFINPATQAVAEMHRALAPGGIIGNAIWSSSGCTDLWSRAVRTVDPSFQSRDMWTEDIRSPKDLEQAYAEAGFMDIKTTETPMYLEFDNAESFVDYFIGAGNPFFGLVKATWTGGKAGDVRGELVKIVREHYDDGKIPFVAACVVARKP